MSASRTLLLLALLTSLTFGCARREKAKTAVITTPATTTTPGPATPRATVPTGAARDLTDVMTDELNLSAEQQTKVRAILATTVNKVNVARQQYGTDRAALTAELRQINTNSENQLKETLTAAQYQQYQAKKRSMQEQMRARRQGGN